jgi:hypothetical protein
MIVDEDEEASPLEAHLQTEKWAGARITGELRNVQGLI